MNKLNPHIYKSSVATKADTLEYLRPLLFNGVVLPLYKFTLEQWRQNKYKVIQNIRRALSPCSTYIVRSSNSKEDALKESNAGHFQSFPDIASDQTNQLIEAIDMVFECYNTSNLEEQVFIQPMVEFPQVSGVLFTRTLETRAPYFQLSFDDTSQVTHSITSGCFPSERSLFIDRQSPNLEFLSSYQKGQIKRLLNLAKEIEELTGFDSLDIEFCIKGQKIYVFQVRPLSEKTSFTNKVSGNEHTQKLNSIESRIASYQTGPTELLGHTTYFSDMSDWNPAEIIGTHPKPLALSLYQHQITDDIWAIQRTGFGYRDVIGNKLLKIFGGRPYVDLRACFNSLVPNDIHEKLAQRLVNFQLEKILENPFLHDKVEFEICLSALDLDWETRSMELRSEGFRARDLAILRSALQRKTIKATEGITAEMYDIKILESRYAQVYHSNLPPLEKAALLLGDCRRWGTLAFAHIARKAFICVQLLDSMVVRGFLTRKESEYFYSSLFSVNREFQQDLAAMKVGLLTYKQLEDKYGHLRPGTYDINSLCYRESDKYFNNNVSLNALETMSIEDLIPKNITSLQKELKIFNLETTQFFRLAKDAIEARERAKFIFSRSISSALECLATYGNSIGLSREDLSYLTLSQLLNPVAGSRRKVRDNQLEIIQRNRVLHEKSLLINLPSMIFHPKDVFGYELPDTLPNFVTSKKVASQTTLVGEGSLMNKIVILPNADPGFDWIFNQGIKGFITKFGGMNSHMAIRAAEMQLPAVIGVGEKIYQAILKEKEIILDCEQKKIIRPKELSRLPMTNWKESLVC